jgi:hypothetical protein
MKRKDMLFRKMYGPFKEIDNTWRTRRNDKLNHIIGNRYIVAFISS